VIETSTFLKKAGRFFDDDERAEIVFYVASNPEAGQIMPETGGVRKLRWGVEGRGKSGGVRVIYYFHNDLFPLFLLDLYAKNEKPNLSRAERNAMKRVTAMLVKEYGVTNLR
jgi:hypothetical protein